MKESTKQTIDKVKQSRVTALAAWLSPWIVALTTAPRETLGFLAAAKEAGADLPTMTFIVAVVLWFRKDASRIVEDKVKLVTSVLNRRIDEFFELFKTHTEQQRIQNETSDQRHLEVVQRVTTVENFIEAHEMIKLADKVRKEAEAQQNRIKDPDLTP